MLRRIAQKSNFRRFVTGKKMEGGKETVYIEKSRGIFTHRRFPISPSFMFLSQFECTINPECAIKRKTKCNACKVFAFVSRFPDDFCVYWSLFWILIWKRNRENEYSIICKKQIHFHKRLFEQRDFFLLKLWKVCEKLLKVLQIHR